MYPHVYIVTPKSCSEFFVDGSNKRNFLLILLNALYSWDVLNIASGVGKSNYSDRTIMFAAGYLEGALTAR